MVPSLPLAERYQDFRAQVFSGIAETPALLGWGEPMTELQIQSLWFGGEFGTSFTSAAGEQIVIRDFGVWNAGHGPDFTNCTIAINGVPQSGDIELDPDVRDWERHGHGSNEDFNRVVLHVFIDSPVSMRAYTRTAEHREVPQIKLTPEMLNLEAKPSMHLAPARLGRCSTPLREMPESAVRSLIESAAQHRLQLKAKRLHLGVAAHGREQTLYQALAQTLGYRNNTRPFTLLTQRLTLRRLLAMEPQEREALMYGVAGFLNAMPFDEAEDDTRAYLRGLWEHWWKLRSEYDRWLSKGLEMKWNLKATRPGNHPQRRLGALATLLTGWSKVSGPILNPEKWNREQWALSLASLQHLFWSLHYTLTAEPASRPVALIGETRVQEMLANVVYPFLIPQRPALWAEYLELPAMLDNQKVRRAVLRLFGTSPLADTFQKKLHHQQGLVQIYEDFCLVDDSSCSDCPFPERLAQWK